MKIKSIVFHPMFFLVLFCSVCDPIFTHSQESSKGSSANDRETKILVATDPLISLLQNFPERYELKYNSMFFTDAGAMNTHYQVLRDGEGRALYVTSSDEHLLEKKAEEMQFKRVLDNSPTVEYLCRCDDEYWVLRGKQMITWTNRNLAVEESNELNRRINRKEKYFEGGAMIFPFLNESTWNDEKHFIVKDQLGELYANGDVDRNDDRRMKKVTTIYKKPEKQDPVDPNATAHLLGKIWEYSYEKDVGVSYFPSTVNQYDIHRWVRDGKEEIKTNKVTSYSFSLFTTNVSFTKKDFEIPVSLTDTNYTHYWIVGTNKVYIHSKNKQVYRVLEAGESDAMRKRESEHQSKYRRLYVTLAIILGFGVFAIVAIKRRNKHV